MVLYFSARHSLSLLGNAKLGKIAQIRPFPRSRSSTTTEQQYTPLLFTAISFFRFVNIPNEAVDSIVECARSALAETNVKGTLLISPEGYNGQFALPSDQIEEFKLLLKEINDELFADVDINIGKTTDYRNNEKKFPFRKLLVRRRKEALTDGGLKGIDWTNAGPALTPAEWHEALMRKSKQEYSDDVANVFRTDSHNETDGCISSPRSLSGPIIFGRQTWHWSIFA